MYFMLGSIVVQVRFSSSPALHCHTAVQVKCEDPELAMLGSSNAEIWSLILDCLRERHLLAARLVSGVQ